MISNSRGASGKQLYGEQPPPRVTGRRDTFDNYKTCAHAITMSSGTGVTMQSYRAFIALGGAVSACVPHTRARPKPALAQLSVQILIGNSAGGNERSRPIVFVVQCGVSPTCCSVKSYKLG